MDDLTSTTEKELISLALSGHSRALNHLLGLYQEKIFLRIRSQVADYAIACDLVQETNLKIIRYLHNFKGNSSFSTWLYRIIQNTIKNHYRALSPEFDDISCSEGFSSMQESNSPESYLIAIQLEQKINKIFISMPKELRYCFYLYIADELGYEEIASLMQCPLGTVRSRIHRAKAILLENIGRQGKRI